MPTAKFCGYKLLLPVWLSGPSTSTAYRRLMSLGTSIATSTGAGGCRRWLQASSQCSTGKRRDTTDHYQLTIVRLPDLVDKLHAIVSDTRIALRKQGIYQIPSNCGIPSSIGNIVEHQMTCRKGKTYSDEVDYFVRKVWYRKPFSDANSRSDSCWDSSWSVIQASCLMPGRHYSLRC